MCQLLGLSFNVSVRPEISFRGFMRRGRSNPDGWGLALYPDGKAAQVLKEPVEAGRSSLAAFLRDYPDLKSSIFIGHVRLGNVGGHIFRNTHPFERVLGDRNYVFAHNGTLRGTGRQGRQADGEIVPLGETDSEWAFCRILEWIKQRGLRVWSDTDYAELAGFFRDLNSHGNLNVLMSDGERLFCYHDAHRYNGLCYVRREFEHTRIKLADEDWVVDLGKVKEPGQKGYVVATRALTNEPWRQFEGGQLIVFAKGEDVYN